MNIRTRFQTYARNQILFHEGNTPSGLFYIRSGAVKLQQRGHNGAHQILKICGSDELLGCAALFASLPYAYSAIVLQEAQIRFIDHRVFRRVIRRNMHATPRLLKYMASETIELQNMLCHIAMDPVRQRLAWLLLCLEERYGCSSHDGTLLSIRLSREELAQMIGAASETVIRVLAEFRRDGYISMFGRSIVLTDVEGLHGECMRGKGSLFTEQCKRFGNDRHSQSLVI